MQNAGRGREAEQPLKLGRAGWRDVFRRVRREAQKDHLDVVAAGVAFFGFLSLFPALAAGVALYGLVSNPSDAVHQLQTVLSAAPEGVREIVGEEAARLAGESSSALSFGLIGTVALALWSANKGTKGLLTALNIAYDEHRERSFVRGNAVSLALTLGAVVSVGVLLGLLMAVPLLLQSVGLGGFTATLVRLARWPVIACWILLSLAVLYRVGPTRQSPKWRWVTPGSLLATTLCLLASVGFSYYASKFGSFNKTYGALGAVAILLTWLYLSAFAILLGAEVNAEAEHQTKRDSTTGPDKPMGQREAYTADTLGT